MIRQRKPAPAPAKAPAAQAKLAVGRPGDAWEREADAAADRVATGATVGPLTPLAPGALGAAQPMRADEAAGQAPPLEALEDETPVQTQPLDGEEEPLQMQAPEAEEETLQMQPAEEEEDALPMQAMAEPDTEDRIQTEALDEEEAVAQTRSGGPGGAPRAAAAAAIRDPGPGAPLPEAERDRLEAGFGADFGDVRVHEGAEADRAARGLNARAFAHGRDVWLAAGESVRDTRLMAHELAHVVQQTGAAPAPPAPARAGAAGAGPAAPTPPAIAQATGTGAPSSRSELPDTVLDMAAKTLTIDKVSLPAIANGNRVTFPATAPKPNSRDTDQRLEWLQTVEISEGGVRAATPDEQAVSLDTGASIWFLRLANSQNFMIGDRETLRAGAKIPNWKHNGVTQYFQVDHIHEHQLGGPDRKDNYQLLDGPTNRAKGNAVRDEVRRRITAALGRHMAENPVPQDGAPDPFAEARALRNRPDQARGLLDVSFLGADPDTLSISATPIIWDLDQIERAEHLAALTPTKDESIRPPLGTSAMIVVFAGEAGLPPVEMPLEGGQPTLQTPKSRFAGINNLMVFGVDYAASGTTAQLTLDAKFIVYGKVVDDIGARMTLDSIGNPFTFQMPTDLMQTGLARRLNMSKASPITVDQAVISDGKPQIRGTLAFSSPLFRGATATVGIDGEDVFLAKTFTGGEFDLPGPVDITRSSLTFTVGTSGGAATLSLDGEVGFAASGIGEGVLRGSGSLVDGVAVEGEFDFDPALFRGADARIRVGYADDTFSGEGTIRIGEGQIRGIRRAELAVAVEDGTWTAEGTVEPAIPGVSEGSLSMRFGADGGFEITGRLTLGEGIPRLRSGHLEARLEKVEDRYIVSASGEAALDIPGVPATLRASYRDGLFTAEARASFARGIARGELSVGATNQAVDPETGQPSGEPGEALILWGSGAVTLRFTPWLEGTAGIAVSPDGQIEVRGRVAVPDEIEVFAERRIERRLVAVSADIPIFGVAVAGQRIGVFLTIGGSLDVRAAIGPGTLRDVGVEVVWNPEDDSATRVTGTARFVVPADAGLRLAITGGIGAGIPIVSATAGLELGGELGVQGEAVAAAEVEWTPTTGIGMQARLSVSASPKFVFDLTGFARVEADLLLTTVELYSERWTLARRELGSGLTVGAALDIVMENGVLRPISLDDVTFTLPDVDPLAVARDAIRAVV